MSQPTEIQNDILASLFSGTAKKKWLSLDEIVKILYPAEPVETNRNNVYADLCALQKSGLVNRKFDQFTLTKAGNAISAGPDGMTARARLGVNFPPMTEEDGAGPEAASFLIGTRGKLQAGAVKFELHTDGSCPAQGGRGGWAYCYYGFMPDGSKTPVKAGSGYEAKSTNNRMEMRAVIEGIKAIDAVANRHCEIFLHSDSQYVLKGLCLWYDNWVRKNKQNVMNRDLWEKMIAISKPHFIRAIWVKGHAGHAENERCDQMAAKESAGI